MIGSKVYAVASSSRSCHVNSGGEKGGADAVVAVGWGDLGWEWTVVSGIAHGCVDKKSC